MRSKTMQDFKRALAPALVALGLQVFGTGSERMGMLRFFCGPTGRLVRYDVDESWFHAP
jgi:hypothetical protein